MLILILMLILVAVLGAVLWFVTNPEPLRVFINEKQQWIWDDGDSVWVALDTLGKPYVVARGDKLAYSVEMLDTLEWFGVTAHSDGTVDLGTDYHAAVRWAQLDHTHELNSYLHRYLRPKREMRYGDFRKM